jgi:hypothetical protein
MTDITVTTDNSNITISQVIESVVTVTPVIETVVQAFPAGLKGDKGDNGDSVVYSAPPDIITTPIGGNQVIAILNGLIVPADSSNLTFLGKVIGMTAGATTIGLSAPIVTSGVLNGFTGLTVGGTYFLGAGGNITNIIPTTGFIQQIGTAITSELLVIGIQQAIQIA